MGKVVYMCVLFEVIYSNLKDYALIMLPGIWSFHLANLPCTDNKHQAFVNVIYTHSGLFYKDVQLIVIPRE